MRPALALNLVFVLALSIAAPVAAETPTRAPRSAADMQLSFAPVVRSAAPAVVNIYAARVVSRARSPFADDPFFSRLFRDFQTAPPRLQNALGSGVIVRPEGVVVTNHHVIGGASEIRVVLADRREYAGEVLLSDAEADLAVIRLAGASGLPALDLADSDGAEVGDLVLAVGNPFGVGQTVSSGIVSALARSAGGGAGRGGGYFIQTDAPINPGNSGGALVDMDGNLLGVNTSILTRSGGSEGVGFAIPSNLVRAYVEQALDGARALARPWAGVRVQPVDADLAAALGLDRPRGVLVAEAHARSPLVAAGLGAGDLLTAIDGLPVDTPAEFDYRLITRGGDGAVSLEWRGAGGPRRAEAALGPPPEDPPRDELSLRARNVFDGLRAANLNPALMEAFGLGYDARGVVVLETGGLSRRTGLAPGDILRRINGVAIPDTATLRPLASEAPGRWEIEIDRNGRRLALRLSG